MSKKLTKEQQKELKAIFKDVVKNGLKRNASSTRILGGEVTNEKSGATIFVDAYFFTVASSGLTSTNTVRWNIRFVTKEYPTEEEAFERLKTLIADPSNYNFEKIVTDEDALYRQAYQSVYVES